MYDYGNMSDQEQREVVSRRYLLGFPLHEPPHYPDGLQLYLITGACFRHQPIMNSEERRGYFQDQLLNTLSPIPDVDIRAWVVLPNHYHVLTAVDLARIKAALARLHNGTATRWNREDAVPGRRVWFRFSDRRIRSERHYYASLNYVHGNPVKHGHVAKATEWPCCSVHEWTEKYGRDWMLELWRDYPVKHFGKGWDD